ncbi:putative ubiquitin family protein [Erysiphe neolycopersici]|uniref:Putative ubiquitin family protein n=1 Tax=Erysiphe neolycopersici TaxID=212602 RepID=A0A420HNZ5_9PEZI|nr:putative ubiquitin family protein [Erysiphe neolycopersici]
MSEFKSVQTRTWSKSSPKSKEEIKNSSISLQVVSPSAGVPKSLDFHDLPVATQVKDLKKQIRDSLCCRPADDLQRLIYHGRMLTRETETMLEIFGEEALRNSNIQTVHLVLRPGSENLNNSSSNDSKVAGTLANPISMRHSQSQATETPIQSFPSANHSQDIQTQPLISSHQYQQQQTVLLQLEELQSLMGQRLLQLQHETQRLNQELHYMGVQASFQPNLIESGLNEQLLPCQLTSPTQDLKSSDQANTISNLQNQTKISRMSQILKRNEDSVGGNTIQGSTSSRSGQENQGYQRSDQPALKRENMLTNAQKLQDSSNDTSEAFSNHLSQNHQQNFEQITDFTNDLRSILQNSNRLNILNQQYDPHGCFNIDSESSGPKMVSSTAIPASSVNPVLNSLLLSSNSKFAGETSGTDFSTPNTFINSKPLVYILSSPSGPRAILMSNAHYYFTPSRNSGRNRFNVGNARPISISSSTLLERGRSARRQARETRNHNEHAPESRAAAPQANQRAGGIGIQVGQILWIIIRLVGFVWFFTAGNPSWSRWLVASGFAFFIFIILTGVLNGAVEQVWSPIRRHLESLVPLGPVQPLNVPLQPNGAPELARGEDRNQGRPQLDVGNHNSDDSGSERNHIEISGRSIEQRAQSNNGILMTQLRRLEQSLILFVASLVPGVSERHIAHREAEANREIERQQLMQVTAEQTSRVSSENNLSAPIQDGENSMTNEQNQVDRPLG